MKALPAIVAAAALGLATSAFAQTGSPSSTPGMSQSGASSGQITSESELRNKLQQQGYTNISNIQRQGDIWQAQAMKGGQQVTLNINQQTGQVMQSSGTSSGAPGSGATGPSAIGQPDNKDPQQRK